MREFFVLVTPKNKKILESFGFRHGSAVTNSPLELYRVIISDKCFFESAFDLGSIHTMSIPIPLIDNLKTFLQVVSL